MDWCCVVPCCLLEATLVLLALYATLMLLGASMRRLNQPFRGVLLNFELLGINDTNMRDWVHVLLIDACSSGRQP